MIEYDYGNGWALGELPNGEEGLFPQTYIEFVEPKRKF